jgi:hypothetical protein
MEKFNPVASSARERVQLFSVGCVSYGSDKTKTHYKGIANDLIRLLMILEMSKLVLQSVEPEWIP